mmetsp:Transcript_65911/g.137622  ORF Transcript_65911/g.137622 Transcript_65911/m.137622 type:complete len:302 (+) Transcript_65911:1453-2358(+)
MNMHEVDHFVHHLGDDQCQVKEIKKGAFSTEEGLAMHTNSGRELQDKKCAENEVCSFELYGHILRDVACEPIGLPSKQHRIDENGGATDVLEVYALDHLVSPGAEVLSEPREVEAGRFQKLGRHGRVFRSVESMQIPCNLWLRMVLSCMKLLHPPSCCCKLILFAPHRGIVLGSMTFGVLDFGSVHGCRARLLLVHLQQSHAMVGWFIFAPRIGSWLEEGVSARHLLDVADPPLRDPGCRRVWHAGTSPPNHTSDAATKHRHGLRVPEAGRSGLDMPWGRVVVAVVKKHGGASPHEVVMNS